MTVIPPAAPGGSVVFCDEVRAETSGKNIYIGVYTDNQMKVLAPFPVRLPSFAMVITYCEAPERVGEPVKIRAFAPDGKGGVEDILHASIAAHQKQKQPPADNVRLFRTLVLQTPNLELKGAGTIQVNAVLDEGGDEYYLGSLSVESGAPAEAPERAAPPRRTKKRGGSGPSPD